MTQSPASYTDVGNADRFRDEHVDRLRHVGTWQRWIAYDGKRWPRDETGVAIECAKLTAKAMFETASLEYLEARTAFDRAMAVGDDELASLHRERMQPAKRVYDHALDTLRRRARIEAMVSLAASDPALAITHHELDGNPWLLNVANGTLDLRTGGLQPHRREDLLTKISEVAFDPRAKCPLWRAFLEHAFAGDEEMIDFYGRAVGYTLTGVIRDHVLLFLFGEGGTGKSTAMRIQHELVGDYGVRAPRKLLFATKGDRHETELTVLHGARFVSCSEVDAGAVFDEALVKDLTGGEDITARRMRENHWTFRPTHKLWIAGNHKPRVRHFDDAMRRRLRLVPFVVKPTTVDTALFDKLRAELPGILNWAVDGCLRWQRDGLGEPVAVRDATDAYREESDPLAEFFDLTLVFEGAATMPRKMLREAYEEYCRENGAMPADARRVAAALKKHGVEDTRVRHLGKVVNGWKGVRLATDAERERRYIVGTNNTIIGQTRAPAHDSGNVEVGTNALPTERWEFDA